MSPGQSETTCGTLLNELQIIWDEVGETDAEKDRMLLELERECLEVYRRKVDQANKCRAQLRQAIADAEAELAAICSAMGERPVHIRQTDQNIGSLKNELGAILPQIEEMRKRKDDRKNQFIEVKKEIQNIKNEIYSSGGHSSNDMTVDDLSLRCLEELQRELEGLQKEKCERLKQVTKQLNYLYSCCSVLGLDFEQTASEIHPSLGEPEGSKNISNDTIEKLGSATQGLKEIKRERMRQLQDLVTSLLELWNLMDTPMEEQQIFQKVTCNIAASEDEIAEPDMLSADYINYVRDEVSRLEELKKSKMKELVLKKKSELNDVCRKTHLAPGTDGSIDIAIEAVESGAVDASFVLDQIELQISRVKEEALSRSEILEKVEKWMAACDEESWLEEYNRDENRYNAGRGAHLTLKRAEKARALVNKLPAMVDTLTSKTTAWENERGVHFTYDGVRLLSMLEDYTVLRQEKELERKRQRDQKKLQGLLLTEKEALYGSKPSPMKNQSAKKGSRLSCGGVGVGASNRRCSLGGSMLQTPRTDMVSSAKATPNTRTAKKMERMNQDCLRDDGFAALSPGRRGLDLAGLPTKQNSLNHHHPHVAQEFESPMTRKPFSPICSTDSLIPNVNNNILEDHNRKHDEMLQKTATNNTPSPFATPIKTAMIRTAEIENHTSQAMAIIPVPSTTAAPPAPMGTAIVPAAAKLGDEAIIPVPYTTSTVSIPMQVAVTPAQMPAAPPPAPMGTAIVPAAAKLGDEAIEYSFEERRAGFVLPRSRLMSLARV